MRYFSDREHGKRPQTQTEITSVVWRGITAFINSKLDDGSFGERFPEMCPDGRGPCGADQTQFLDTLKVEIPSLSEQENVLLETNPPSLTDIMDIIEFCWNSIGEPENLDFHPFFSHHHLNFDGPTGKKNFRERINFIFERNGLAYLLNENGDIERLAPKELGEVFAHSSFQTGDDELNQMLERAQKKFLSSSVESRRESLEKLWDAWERIKTLNETDKKAGIASLLNDAAGSAAGSDETKFRSMLEEEARALTDAGNNFQIRHTETDQERLGKSEHVDFLFHRLFSLIHLILQTTGRC